MKDSQPLETEADSIPQQLGPSRRAMLVQFRVSNYRFSASLLSVLAVGLCLVALGSLGFWQLDRAAEKIELQAKFTAQLSAPAVLHSASSLRQLKERYFKVKVTGRFVGDERQFLLDNRVYKGRAGYEVLAPLLLEGGELLLVNRGWVPVGESRARKPKVRMPSQVFEAEGIAAIPPQRFSLGDAISAGDDWPKVLQFEDFEAIEKELGQAVIPRVLQLDTSFDWSFQRIWKVVEKGPTQNYGYAAQWFALMLTLAVLVLFFCAKRIPQS